MKRFAYVLVLSLCFASVCCGTNQAREVDFNFDWKFALQYEDAHAADHDDGGWRSLRLPHDWSVEASFDANLEGCTGYLPGGVGWYRKHFTCDANANQITYLYFDGVYNRSEVWLNGTKLGFQPYGYSPFYFDMTEHLCEGDNVLAVKVDRTRYADSRWYTGAGIYRHVKLITVNRLHVPIWGTFVTTPEVSSDTAVVDVEVKIKNAYEGKRDFYLNTVILDPSQKIVASHKETLHLRGNDELSLHQRFSVDQPRLWDVEHPHVYEALTTIGFGGRTIDTVTTSFGIRTIRFDPEQGFFLNGKNTLIKGVCLHHDGGLVGAAVPKGVWQRRLKTLKAGGCNAIRTAHNPPSEEFLDLCDDMGFLVQNEFFDEWDNPKDKRKNMNEQSVDHITRAYTEHFQDWAERDLKATMLRDRNHPSIIQWSIGNEIEWTYPRYRRATGYFDAQWSGNYFWTPPHIGPSEIKQRYDQSEPGPYVCAETAQNLAAWTRALDTTRPVTANCILPSASHVTGYADTLDVVGYSYRRVVYDYARKHFPDKVIMGTENLGQWHEWKAVIERPSISGLFLWTGIDYMGEANGAWPTKGSGCGLLDLAGFEKPGYHMYKTLWSDTPHVYLCTQALDKSPYVLDEGSKGLKETKPGAWQHKLWGWHAVNSHWNYDSPQMIAVEVYANCDSVELLLNDRSLGFKSLSDFPDRIFKWAVPFEPGTLMARAGGAGVQASDHLKTAGLPAAINLSVDKTEIQADGYDVAHCVVQLMDKQGTPVKHLEREVIFEINGPLRVLGVDNGASNNTQDFQSDRIVTDQGRCLLIIQSRQAAGTATVCARSRIAKRQTVVLKVE